MVTAIEYLTEDGEATIYRCYGKGTVLELPETVDGIPVTGIADHCFAAEPSFLLRKEPRKIAFTGGETSADVAGRPVDPPLCAALPEEIWLPKSLARIGGYAFYGCCNLKVIHIPETMSHLGGGCFVACNHIQSLCFYEPAGLSTEQSNMRDVINEITYEMEVVSEDANGKVRYRLVYPEYIEESIENTPARIIEMHFEGSGFRFRQCFRGGRPDLVWYDTVFHEASMMEYPETLQKLAFARLVYPLELKDKAKKEYLGYLAQHPEQTADYLCREQRVDGLQALCENGFFTGELLDLFLEKTSAASWPEAVSILMDLRRKCFPVKRKRYEF